MLLRYPIKSNIHYACKSKFQSIMIIHQALTIDIGMVCDIIVLNRWKFRPKISTGNVHQKTIVKVFYQILQFQISSLCLFPVANNTIVNYTTQFLGVQYFVDLAIIQYVTGNTPSISSVSSFFPSSIGFLSIEEILFRSIWTILVVLQFLSINSTLVLTSLCHYSMH